MIYGRVFFCLSVIFGAFLLPLFLAAAPRSAKSATLSVTLLSAGNGALQAQGSDGRAFSVAVTPASLFLRRGLLVSATDFTPGETVLLRQHAGRGGQAQVALLCDTDSAAAIERYRRRPITGTILSASSQNWVVQPADSADGVPLTLKLSSQITYHVSGAIVAASVFGPGASVTLMTRGLPNGLLSIVSVSEAAEQAAPTELRVKAFVSGEVLEVQPEAGTLTVQDKTGASFVVAVDAGTRIKVHRQPGTLADIQAGMRVSVWLGTSQDTAGKRIATSISALDAARRKKSP